MMSRKQIVVTALALAGTWVSGAAQAHGNLEVQWSVNIGGPIGVSVHSAPARHTSHPVVVVPVPSVPRYVSGYGDRDRDGIPNRYDRVYNPRWDRDGDGVPNRYDRRDGQRDHRCDDRQEDHPRYRPGR